MDYPDAFMTPDSAFFQLPCPSHHLSTLSDIAKSSIKTYLIIGGNMQDKNNGAAPTYFKFELYFYGFTCINCIFGAAVMDFYRKGNVCR